MNIFFQRDNPESHLAGAKSTVKAEQSEPKESLYSDRALARISEGVDQEKRGE